MVHNSIYDELKRLELAVWRDAYSNSLYFRVKPYDEKQKTDKTKLSDFLTVLINRNIDIYNDTSDIKYQKSDFLIISLLPMVKMEVCDPLFPSEFIYIQNNMFYKNSFRYTKFLEKRFNTNNQGQFPLNRNNTAVKFIEELSLDKKQSESIINWIASFFQLMIKNNTALILIGDNETTEILVNNIIKPIFAFKESDFCTINNDTLKNIDYLSLQNKIFYHIDDISGTPSNCTKASKIVKQLLKTTPSYNESIEREMLHIHGQVIVTADNHNPYPILKDSYSRCIVFKVKNLKTILKSFQLESLELEEKIKYDLDDFCNSLSNYNCNFAYFPKTSEKELLTDVTIT